MLETVLFWIVALITGGCAVAVVVTQNIVRAATWLLFSLAGTSAIFFLLGADFVGATQLLVYVGGTLVLVVFGVMLTAQGPFISLKASAAEWGLTTVVGLLLLSALAVSVLMGPMQTRTAPLLEGNPASSMNSAVLGEALLGIKEVTPEARLTRMGGGGVRRQQMGYLLPFEIVSVHLLVVLIGAAYLARAKRRRGAVAP
jgi:NADH-quinone oxidoreductase subunit J